MERTFYIFDKRAEKETEVVLMICESDDCRITLPRRCNGVMRKTHFCSNLCESREWMRKHRAKLKARTNG